MKTKQPIPRSRTKLVERLSHASLAAVARATGRTVQQVLETAGVRA